jgi:hypothetical protein
LALFASEAAMQAWLKNSLIDSHGLADLIIDVDSLKSFSASSLAENKILKSFRTCLASLYLNEVISENENISIDPTDILKPDFVLYAPETESVVIIELKNIAGPTRQTGTELAAYSCEIQSSIPFISDGDIVNVVISAEWPTLLRHYVFHQIFWQGKNVLCLAPFEVDGNVRLKILGIKDLSQDAVSFKISEKHIGGYQICLHDNELYTAKADRTRLDKFLEQMKTALHAMAIRGSSQNNHGFAFLWKDHWDISLAPYSITLLNFAPFQSIERFLHLDNFELPEMVKRFMNISKEFSPIGHGNSLDEIRSYGCQFLNNICSPRPEDFTYWYDLRESMLSNSELIAFEAWGMFGEIFSEKLAAEYSQGNLTCSATSPQIGLKVIEELIDSKYKFVDLAYIDYEPEDNS